MTSVHDVATPLNHARFLRPGLAEQAVAIIGRGRTAWMTRYRSRPDTVHLYWPTLGDHPADPAGHHVM
jgi:hypothetical protein